ncbi:MAG: hypothetical protein NC914_03265 [Candidatus Omnitrophica bacterium]|nr:hypothetical protein [Candidatus Omnitrophota bacterium]
MLFDIILGHTFIFNLQNVSGTCKKEAQDWYFKIARLYSEDNPFFVKALLRIAQICENNEQISQQRAYKKIMAFDIKEARSVAERFAVLGN